MASLTGQTIASSYEQLLHTDTDGGGNGNSLLSIKDGDNGTTFALKLATNKVEVIPGSDDANAFEVSKADGTPVLTVDSTNARVGIGEPSPAVPLHITGGNLRLDHTRPMIQFEETDGTADQNWQLDVAAGVFRFQTNNDTFSLADTKVVIDQSGNVGIGIDSSILGDVHIKKDAAFLMLEATAGGASPSDLKIQQDYRTSILGTSAGDGQFVFKNNVSSAGEPKDSGDVLMVIQDGPAVGIGTSSPVEKLYVNSTSGDARIGLNAPTSSDTEIKFSNNGTVEYTIGHDDATDNFVIGGTNVDAALVSVTKAGNVGIGTTNPSRLLDLETTNAAGSTLMSLVSATDGNCQLLFGDTSSDTQGKVLYNNDGDYMAFTANGSERMRIDSSGRVGIGTTNPTYKLDVEESGAGTFPASVVHSDGTTPRGLRITFSGGNSFGNTDDYAIFFEDNTAAHFYVAGDGSVQNVSGTYGSALSDERLKENIVDATGKLDDLLKLKVKNFTFTNDSTATKHIGFIAQEFEQVFPSLVTERDDSEHSGITDLKGLQVGMEFAILVKAIQELSAQNDSLTARIEALENA